MILPLERQQRFLKVNLTLSSIVVFYNINLLRDGYVRNLFVSTLDIIHNYSLALLKHHAVFQDEKSLKSSTWELLIYDIYWLNAISLEWGQI